MTGANFSVIIKGLLSTRSQASSTCSFGCFNRKGQRSHTVRHLILRQKLMHYGKTSWKMALSILQQVNIRFCSLPMARIQNCKRGGVVQITEGGGDGQHLKTFRHPTPHPTPPQYPQKENAAIFSLKEITTLQHFWVWGASLSTYIFSMHCLVRST